MTNEHFTQIATSLNESSTHLQALRERYDGALTKIEAQKNETLQALDSKKTQGVEALEAKKSELDSALSEAMRNHISTLSEEAERARRYTLSDDFIIKVGNAEDEKRTLKDAYNEALKYTSTFKDGKSQAKVIIEIQEGWEWEEPLGLYDMDLSGIILRQKNYETPIMVNLANGVKDNGLNCLIYLDNSKITLGRLHLKAKAHTLSNVYFHSMCYGRKNSTISAFELKFDYSQVSRDGQSGRIYPIFIDDNSNLSVINFTGILRSDQVIGGEGFGCCENSRAYIETFTLEGHCEYNGVLCNASSSAYIGTLNLNGNCGHNGVCCTASSSACVSTVNLNGNCGHNGVLCAASMFNAWGNNHNFSRGSSPGCRIAVDWNGYITIHSSCKNGQNFTRMTNIAENTWTPQGVIRFS